MMKEGFIEMRPLADERVGGSHTFSLEGQPYYDSHCLNKDVPALIKFAEDGTPLMSVVNFLNIREKSRLKSEE